jgi:hypothetical protein
MLFKPYYIVQAWSKSRQRLQTQFITTEMTEGRRCTDIKEAEQRANAFAQSLNEAKKLNAADWEPKVHLVSDAGKFLVRRS